jgi:hypothetical protein
VVTGFPLATNAERVCAEIMLKQRARARTPRSSLFVAGLTNARCAPVPTKFRAAAK